MKEGFVCDLFDLYYAGHSMMLKECKKNCYYLVISLSSAIKLSRDKNHPIYTVEERKIILESIKYVDEVIIYDF